jgi:hypothetical protein
VKRTDTSRLLNEKKATPFSIVLSQNSSLSVWAVQVTATSLEKKNTPYPLVLPHSLWRAVKKRVTSRAERAAGSNPAGAAQAAL